MSKIVKKNYTSPPVAEIITVGKELIIGQINDTNSVYLSQRLHQLGFLLQHKSSVDDNEELLANALKLALIRSDLVITCGGLGPTFDDITREAIAKATERKLVLDNQLAEKITLFYKTRHPEKEIPASNLKQAYVPEGAQYLVNQYGTAPGLILEEEKKMIIALPGPQNELKPMFESQVIPILEKKFSNRLTLKVRVIKTVGIPESEVNEKIKPIIQSLNHNIEYELLAYPGEVDIQIIVKEKEQNKADQILLEVEEKLNNLLGDAIFGKDSETLESVIGKLLCELKLRIAIAESCTGGLLGHRITNVPGSSNYFDRGIVAYSNQAKKELLGVPEEILNKYGAVSSQTAIAMAKGMKKISNADVTLAITGIAGPAGGTPEKPVGLVYIALAGTGEDDIICHQFNFSGDRETIKLCSSQSALSILRTYLLNKKKGG